MAPSALCVSVKVETLPREKPDQKHRGERGHTLDYEWALVTPGYASVPNLTPGYAPDSLTTVDLID